jgi:hypothetical protein
MCHQSGGGCVRTHVPRVDTGRRHITTTCGYTDQLQRIVCRWFQGQGSDSCSTWDSFSRENVRSGTVKSWGYGSSLFFTPKFSIFGIKIHGGCPKSTNPKSTPPRWRGWKLCLDHWWNTMTVGLVTTSNLSLRDPRQPQTITQTLNQYN